MPILDYSGEGAEFTGFATGLGEGIKEIKAEEKAEANRQYVEQVRQMEFEMDIEKMRTAHMLDLEKMTQRSLNDFTREEQRRQDALDKYENTIRYLEAHADDFDEEQIDFVRTNSYLQLLGSGVKLPASSFYDEPESLRGRPASTSEMMRAFGELTELEGKPREGFVRKMEGLIPGGRTGKELTPLETQQQQYLQEVVSQTMKPVSVADAEPVQQLDFEQAVEQLKAVDPVKAQAYFNQWKNKWPGEYE
jgi:hypothetical protein